MIKAIFIARTRAEAAYWARQWGYGPRDWMYVNETNPSDLHGFRAWDWPVFTCGSGWPTGEVWDELKARGFEVYDAQTIEEAAR